MAQKGSLYVNPSAKDYILPNDSSSGAHTSQIRQFHETLPDFAPTALIALPVAPLASFLNLPNGVKIFVKDESSRLGLGAYKILGASWGVYRAITNLANMPLSASTPPPSLSTISTYAQQHSIHLFAATDGNHGRAVAHMASLLGISASIYVPRFTDSATQRRIADEGPRVKVHVVQGDYDATCVAASSSAKATPEATPGGLVIQDNAFPGYTEIPAYIVEGYSTLLDEVESQLVAQGLTASTIVTAIGAGTLGHATVGFAKSGNRNISVLAVEPENAACLNTSLRNGQATTVETSTTIMDGMNCGTVSPISWPVLQRGVDVSITISDGEAHQALLCLKDLEVNAGPCGASTLAGLRKVLEKEGDVLGLHEGSVVVLLSTEGPRPYPIPQ